MKRRSRLAVVAGFGVACLFAAGCAVADPDTSQDVLHYQAGPFSSQAFVNCVTPGTRQVDSPNDLHFYYPHGVRTWDFTGGPGSDSPPLQVTTKNANGITTVTVRGTATFSLNTDCRPWKDPLTKTDYPGGPFQAFHDNIGRHNVAFASNGSEAQPVGWNNVVGLYVGGPIEKALNNEGLTFDWLALIGNADNRNLLQDRAMAKIPALIDQQARGPYFKIYNLQIQSVSPPADLTAALNATQSAQLRAQTATVDEQTSAGFPGGLPAYADYQLKLAQVKCLNDGKCTSLIPSGTSIAVPGR